MIGFEFATAGRIIFGAGKFSSAGELAASFGKRVLLVTGGRSVDSAVERLGHDLNVRGAQWERFVVQGEPNIPAIQKGLEVARAFQADVVFGLGGGTAMDSAKCLAALLTNPGNLFDYLEVVGKGQAISQPPLPCLCIPTTAGTGSEVTRNAVIDVPEQRRKVSMRGLLMLAKVALVDPELTYALPRDVTAQTGLDALTQLIESYVSIRATVLSQAIVESALPYAAQLKTAFSAAQSGATDDSAKAAREAMSYAALCSGLALANSGLGVVHGFASLLGARYALPHGLCCGILLPHVVEANYRRDSVNRPALWDRLARLLGQPNASALIDYLHQLTRDLGLPTLSKFGVQPAEYTDLVGLAKLASSTKANPVELTDEELAGILTSAI